MVNECTVIMAEVFHKPGSKYILVNSNYRVSKFNVLFHRTTRPQTGIVLLSGIDTASLLFSKNRFISIRERRRIYGMQPIRYDAEIFVFTKIFKPKAFWQTVDA